MLGFDLETDGLLDEVTVIHCIHLYDTETDKHERYNNHGYKADGDIAAGIRRLGTAGNTVIAHNGIGYDYLVLDLLFPGWDLGVTRLDSIVLARLLWPDMKEGDFAARERGYWKMDGGRAPCPEKMGGIIGSHSLKAWGMRFGVHKGDFDPRDHFPLDDAGKHSVTVSYAWQNVGWCEEMDDYCHQDIVVLMALVELIQKRNPPQRAMDLEHQFATIINRQERYGFKFDIDAAKQLLGDLMTRQAELTDKLSVMFPPWEKTTYTDFTPKRDNKTKGYEAGKTIRRSKTTLITFNPGSRDHIADRLITLHGWKPVAMSPNGKAKVDETILKGLNYEPVPLLREYLTIAKRLGQVSEGKQAWLRAVKSDGRIHGRVNTNGAVTGRCTHSGPNMGQVPAVRAAFGERCRALFTVDVGRSLTGADASGLELRCLAHYMAAFDGGAYTDVVLNGDIHVVNQEAAGLPTRDAAKTFIYAFLYGAGDGLIGDLIGKGPRAGRAIKNEFLSNLPALEELILKVQERAEVKGHLIGLDGRRLHVRSKHAALNTLLQSSGALVMKKALCNLDDLMLAEGFTHSDSGVASPGYEYVANIHDEWQGDTKAEVAPRFAELSVLAMQQAGQYFNFRCPIDGEAKTGNNWAETH